MRTTITIIATAYACLGLSLLLGQGEPTSEFVDAPSLVQERLQLIAQPQAIRSGRFTYVMNPITGSALWVGEYLTKDSLHGGGAKDRPFHADPYVPIELRTTNADYAGSGFQRGHLPALANYRDAESQKATCNLSLIVPQDPRLNGGLWAQLEDFVRSLVSDTTAVYVVTVPLYQYRQQAPRAIGPRNVLVPTHLAKSVLVMDCGRPIRARTWLVPNKPPEAKQLASYLISVDELEEVAQCDLFAWLPDELEDELEASK